MTKWTISEEILALYLYVNGGRRVATYSSNDAKRIAAFTGKTLGSIVLKTANFRSFDTSKISEGMRHTSELDHLVWNLYYGKWDALIEDAGGILADPATYSWESAYGNIGNPSRYDLPDFTQSVRRRIGQERVRAMALLNYGQKCCMCGIDHPSILRASHIVPWSARSDIRGDPKNVLCLCALHDALFDSGLISVDSSRKIVTANFDGKYPGLTLELKKIDGKSIAHPKHSFAVPKSEYLEYHLKNVFRG